METSNKTLEGHGLRVIESMTSPTRPGKKPRPVCIVAGKVAGFEEILRDLGGKKFRGQWSFWSDPSSELLEVVATRGRLSYAEQVEASCDRKLAKSERYDGYAEHADTRSAASSRAAHEIGRHIPMGQPILVGHHSERRHRRDIARIDSNMRRAIEESKKSDYFSDKSENLIRDTKRFKEDRSYIMNRIEEEEAYLRRLHQHAASYSNYSVRVNETQEKITYWRSRLDSVENELKASGRRIATPANIKPGFWIKYTGTWYEVIRVSKKSVTVKGWLSVDRLTWKPRYADIDDYRDSTELRQETVVTNESAQQNGGVQ